jgi:hypothetical protein
VLGGRPYDPHQRLGTLPAPCFRVIGGAGMAADLTALRRANGERLVALEMLKMVQKRGRLVGRERAPVSQRGQPGSLSTADRCLDCSRAAGAGQAADKARSGEK